MGNSKQSRDLAARAARAARTGCALLGLTAAALAGDGTRLIWAYDSGAEGWQPRAVSIGNRGTQVFTRVGPIVDRTRVFSAHDSNPPAPVWTRNESVWTYKHVVASAEEDDVHVSIHEQFVSGTSGPKRPVIQKFTSSSSIPDWTYTIPTDHYGNEPAEVRISDDGQRIVAVSYDLSSTFDPRVLVFGPGSPVPIANALVSTSGTPEKILLSGDGRTLYIWGGARITVVDVPSLQVVWVGTILETVQSGHALSFDGRTLAFGVGQDLRIYERGPSGYSEVHRYSFPAGFRCEAVDISRDGSTVVCGANSSNDNLTVRVMAMDLASFQVMMLDQQTGVGSKANLVSAIAAAEDGDTFAVGLWGDEFDTIPELQFYDSREDDPIGAWDLGGSVLSLDLSEDGRHAVVGNKAAHANDFAGNGTVSLFAARPVDLRLNGVPRLGATVEFELYAPGTQPGNGILISSPQLASSPETFPGTGTLHLLRSQLSFFSMGQIGSDGVARRTLAVPNLPPGTNVYYQGLRTNPRTLTRDWVQLTVLP